MKHGVLNLSLFFLTLLPVSCGPIGSDISAQRPGDSPVITSVVALSPTLVRIDWQDRSDGEDGFRIEEKTSQQGSTFALVDEVGENTTSRFYGNLAPGTTYYFRIYYFKGDDVSTYSNVATVTTPTN